MTEQGFGNLIWRGYDLALEVFQIINDGTFVRSSSMLSDFLVGHHDSPRGVFSNASESSLTAFPLSAQYKADFSWSVVA